MNVICDRALLGAYSRESRVVTRRLVRRAAAEVSGQTLTPAMLKWALPILGALGAALLAASLSSMDRNPPPTSIAAVISAPVDAEVTVPRSTSLPKITAEVAIAGPTVEEFLQNSSESTGVDSAMQTLADLWSIKYDPAAGTGCTQAEAQGLSCLFQRGTLNNVRQLDRPVMLTLTGTDGSSYHPVLVSADDTTGELAAGENRARFALDDITDLWFGQFMLLWRPPNGRAISMSRGVRGENVRWLRQSLAALDPEYGGAVSDSDLFDEALEQQLRAFQQRHRLQVDGLAGQQTQIFINSLLALDGTPRLASGR
jgi:general secretion pathway protein A